MSYVDGFVIPVPRESLAEYKKMARKAGKVWMDHGALAYHECVGDDVPVGKRTSFPQSVKLKEGEVVIFSWIIYANKTQRNKTNKLAMADPRLKEFVDPKNVCFDGKRMFWGGFKEIVTF